MKRLGNSFSGALRTFAYWVSAGSVGHPLLQGFDYKDVLCNEPSAIEQIFAIFANVVELDDSGFVTNAKYAEFRAAQSLRRYIDPSYIVEPPFEDWEVALHEPPARIR